MTHGASRSNPGCAFFISTRQPDGKNGETMSDESNAQEQQAQAPEQPTAGDTQPVAAQAERTFTQADVDRIITERLTKEKAKAESMATKAREDAERKAAEEQGKFRELYEAAQQRIAETEARLKSAEIASIKREVAGKLNMPQALANRLQGETLEEIEADAKELMAALPKPAAPNINSGTGNGATPTGVGMSEAEKKELAARLGVDWRYLP